MKLLINEMGYANPAEAKVYLNGIEHPVVGMFTFPKVL